MKTNLVLLGAMGCMLLGASKVKAQEVVIADQTTVELTNVECKNHYYGSWKKNWYLQLGAGVNIPFVEDSEFKSGNWDKDVTAIYNVGVGHWWSPYFGFRFNALYSTVHWQDFGYNSANVVESYRGRFHNASLNIELMWDMINSIRGYKADRVFSLIPFIGVGGNFSWHYDGDAFRNSYDRQGNVKSNCWTLPVSAGLQFRFRLCKYVDFFAEGRFMFYGDEWNLLNNGHPFDINAVALGGFNINFGGREFESYNPCDYLAYIAALNDQVNDLRAALATTAAALAACEAQLPCPEVKPAPAPAPKKPAPMLSCVRFKINSAVVSGTEKVNVYNVAEWMKRNPEVKVTIRAYADKDTGTSAYNKKLSQRRAQSVYDLLTNEYGIDGSRLKCEDFGSDVQPYEVNNWNRIVLFSE